MFKMCLLPLSRMPEGTKKFLLTLTIFPLGFHGEQSPTSC